jgi:hypothetical protein
LQKFYGPDDAVHGHIQRREGDCLEQFTDITFCQQMRRLVVEKLQML